MKLALFHLLWVVPAGIILLVLLLVLAGELGRPVRYEIPEGFRGRVVIQYEDPSCPSLRTSGLYVVIPISESGRGCTKSAVPEGWRYTRYDYVTSDGSRTRISDERSSREPAAFAGSYSPSRKRELLFIGTAEEFERLPWPRD